MNAANTLALAALKRLAKNDSWTLMTFHATEPFDGWVTAAHQGLEAIAALEAEAAQAVEPAMQLDEGGVPKWLPPLWGGARAPGTKLYTTPQAPAVNAELLEVLEAMCDEMANRNWGIKSPAQWESENYQAARAAIARATGEAA